MKQAWGEGRRRGELHLHLHGLHPKHLELRTNLPVCRLSTIHKPPSHPILAARATASAQSAAAATLAAQIANAEMHGARLERPGPLA